MLFQWDCRNRNPVLLIATKSDIYQEASIIEILCVETVMLFQWDCRNRIQSPWIQISTAFDSAGA